MTKQSRARFFLAFGKIIESDIDLPLLAEVSDSGTLKVEARITLKSDPFPVPPTVITRDSTQSVTLHRNPGQVVVALRQIGWLARLQSSPASITLHPIAQEPVSESGPDKTTLRVLGDRVVTNVLPYLPQLWGLWGIHGALLDTPGGSVMLLAPSGSGKSTLSQVLSRDHGWRILDDDTSMLTEVEGSFSFAPMGAKSRLREDAARYLGIDIDGLESYSMQKGLLRDDVHPHPHPSVAVEAFVTVTPVEGATSGRSEPPQPECISLAGLEAMHSLFESFFSIDSDRGTVLQHQLSLSAQLSGIPHLGVRYRRGLHTPHQTAQSIVQAVEQLSEAR